MKTHRFPGALTERKPSVKKDILASVVVFLVALPLCIAIALASGLSATAGIVTGVIGGLLVGFLGGSPLQVSGPAAGLIVIVYVLVQESGVETLGVVLLLAGALQVAAGLLRLGQWFRAVSPAVIQGMLAGIGVLIFAGQFHVMVDDQPKGTGLLSLVSIPEAVYKGLVPQDGSSHHWAANIGILTILVLVGWKVLVPKKLRIVPAPLVAVVAATVAAGLLDLGIRRVDLPDNLLRSIQCLSLSNPARFCQWATLLDAVEIAIVASAETLLCAAAVDKMHSGTRTRYDRELTVQGVGNMACGFLGGLPMTGVIVRSAANIEAGAKTRLSAILHGVWLLVFACVLPFAIRQIPTCCLAAILVYTGYTLMNPRAVRTLWSYGKSEVAIYAATVAAIVATDLLTGVIVGVILSMAKLLFAFAYLSVRAEDDPAANRTVLFLEGAATFIRLPQLAAVLETVRPDTELHVRVDQLTYIDHACLDLLMSWEKRHEEQGGRLVLDWESLFAKFHRLPRGKNVFIPPRSKAA